MELSRLRLSIVSRLWCSHLLAVLLVSGSTGTYFYFYSIDALYGSIQARLQYSAALISQALDTSRLELIRTPEDMAGAPYRELVEQLRSLSASNPDIAFIYVMRREGEQVTFVADSDNSPDQARPGQFYEDVTPALRRGFDKPSVEAQIYSDPWGDFLSGFAPLGPGDGRYLVGLDMRADEVSGKMARLRLSGMLSLGASILLALLFGRLLAGHFLTPIRDLIQGCHAIATGRLNNRIPHTTRDELDQLVDAFNVMAEQLQESRARSERYSQALLQSHEQLEARVQERTAELEALNTQLRDEIQERRRAQAALQQAARTDHLTGLLNRRAMLELLDYEAEKVRRRQGVFSVVLGDIDRFKSINDHHGHDVGDQVLICTAELLRTRVRNQDSVARWGGEEILLLLPDTPLEGARQVAEKLRQTLADSRFEIEEATLNVTISLGVAECRPGDSIDACIQRADRAMYQAKNSGRNRVLALEETN